MKKDEDSVKEVTDDIMGGKVLELESDKLIKKGIELGISQGIQVLVETFQKYGIDKSTLENDLMEKFNLSESEACNYIEKYWK